VEREKGSGVLTAYWQMGDRCWNFLHYNIPYKFFSSLCERVPRLGDSSSSQVYVTLIMGH
jgi:hypothetical protein